MSRDFAGAPNLTGKLLIAEPMLEDPNFERSVVLLIEHSEEGALGVVLNRPTDIDVGAVLEQWGALATDPPVLYVGGPVSQDSLVALGRKRSGTEVAGWTQVLGDVGAVDLHLEPSDLAPALEGIRVFIGYSGWDAAQLEAELAQDAWMVVDAEVEDVFASDPETMWRAVLRRQGGKLARLANFPPHPSVN
ncbi:MAG TPA: YqgE/AlgH family protein [Acidimicrobiales bacterium]